jgi:hypothetical protein
VTIAVGGTLTTYLVGTLVGKSLFEITAAEVWSVKTIFLLVGTLEIKATGTMTGCVHEVLAMTVVGNETKVVGGTVTITVAGIV